MFLSYQYIIKKYIHTMLIQYKLRFTIQINLNIDIKGMLKDKIISPLKSSLSKSK